MSETQEGWTSSTVGQWCPFAYGKGLPERDRRVGDVPVYGSNGVVGFHDECVVEGPGIIVGRKGTVGSVEYASTSFWPIDTTYFVTDAPHRDLRFTSALLGCLGLEHRNSHSAVPGLSREDAHRLEVVVPPLAVQRRIGDVVEALDTRIASATRLEALLGDLIKSECEVAIAQRESEEQISLVEAVSLVNGGAYTKGAEGHGRIVIRIKELNSGPSDTTVYSTRTVAADKTAFPGDVLFAWSGSLGVWRWYRATAIVNQHIFKVIPKAHPIWLGWFHLCEELQRFQDIAAGKATTMGHITKDHLARTLVPALTYEELSALQARVEPLWDAQLRIGQELEALQETKEFLVPRLISGEFRFMEVQELVEVAT